MVRTLLVDLFGLETHTESRPADAYELEVGRGGVRMEETRPINELDRVFSADSAESKSMGGGIVETLKGPVRTTISPRGIRTITEHSMYERMVTPRRTLQVNATRITMAELASLLATNLGSSVVDRTGLTAHYTFTIELPLDAYMQRGPSSLRRAGILDDPVGVSAVRAVEQLGLKLEKRRIPMDTIVVDRLERVPTSN